MREEIRSYRCGTCREIFSCTKTEIEQHEKTELDKPLPVGLIYKTEGSELYHIVIGKGVINPGRENPLGEDWKVHSYNHRRAIFSNISKYMQRVLDANSGLLKDKIRAGVYRPLTDEELERFKSQNKGLEERLGIPSLTNKLKLTSDTGRFQPVKV